MRIVFLGTPEFAVPALEALCASPHAVAAVFTQPDRPAGRGRRVTPPPVKRRAIELGLEVHQPERVRAGDIAPSRRTRRWSWPTGRSSRAGSWQFPAWVR